MSKTIKFIAIILVLAFMLTGCKSVPITSYTKEEIVEIEKIKEQKIDDEPYNEFLTLFKDFAGFDFEKYLFIPERTKYSSWGGTESTFGLFLRCILPKAKAEELLGILRNHPYYKTYYTRSDYHVYCKKNLYTYSSYLDTGRENKSECYYFSRSGMYVDTSVRRHIDIEILPTDDTCNEYLVDFETSIRREPPEGQSCWPEDDVLVNHTEILLDKTGKPIGDG